MSTRVPLLLVAVAAGVLNSFAYPPFALEWLGLISLAILLFILTKTERFFDGFLIGFGFGLGFMAVLIWWMNAVDYRAYIALVLVQAIMFAIVGWGLTVVMISRLWPIIGAAVWVASETLRGSQPFGGFPWGRLSHIVADTFLDSWVRVLGLAGTSAVLFLVVALAVETPRARSLRFATPAAIGIILVLGLAPFLPKGPSEPTGTATIAVVQGDVPGVFGTWTRGEIFDLHLKASRDLVRDVEAGVIAQPDVVIWPENSLDIDPEARAWVGIQLSLVEAELGAPILVGAILDGPDAETAYNAGIVWSQGAERARYVKRNLVPYGEYVPFRQLLGNIVPRFRRDIPRDLLPGETSGAIDIGGVRIGDTICWDIAYDHAVIDNVRDGAELLVTQTSNASFTGTYQPDQQWLISQLRAIETGRDLAVASTNGISGVVSADGTIKDQLPKQQAGYIVTEVVLAEGLTPAMQWGRFVMWVLFAIGTASIIWFYREDRRARARDYSDFQ